MELRRKIKILGLTLSEILEVKPKEVFERSRTSICLGKYVCY
jgi:hypothetical protein